MKRTPQFVQILILSLSSILLTYWISLLIQAPGYTINSHQFQLKIFPIGLVLFGAFLCLYLIWFTDSKFLSKRFGLDISQAQKLDTWSYVPFLFLVLMPLANFRYVSNKDFAARVWLYGLAILTSFISVKIFFRYRLNPEGPAILPKLILKISGLSPKKKLAILFLLALLVFNIGSAVMRQGGISYSGDEPHYLLISHSLLKDGDFNLANNYENQDYSAYMPEGVKLDTHLAPGSGGHSFHSPGVSILLFPFYALGILISKTAIFYFIRFGMSVFGALLGLQIFLYAFQEWKKEKLAFILWLLFCFTTPIFFHSLHIYPEIILALFSLTMFRMLRFAKNMTKAKLAFIGILLGSFIWLHAIKYMFILIPFFLYTLWILLRERKVGWDVLYFLAPPFVLFLLHTLFSYTLYGSLSPFVVSLKGTTTPEESMSLIKEVFSGVLTKYRLETLLGYFFDQRDGLLLYSPIYVFGFLGMIELAKRNIKRLFVLLFLGSPYVLGLAFLTQRGAYAPQARTQVAVFWIMGIFLGYFLVYNAKKFFIYIFSAATAFSYIALYVLLRNPWALYQQTTSGVTQRAGEMFLNLSNLHFYLPQFLPSYLKIDNKAWLPNYVWAGAFILFCLAYLLVKKHDFRPKLSIHLGIVSITLVLVFVLWVFVPQFILQSPTNITLPTGEKLTFYSLGRVIRMPSPGEFQLPRGDRAYIFHITSWRPIESFKLKFGSTHGTFDVNIHYFDQSVFRGKIQEEMKSMEVPARVDYRIKRRHLYRISIELKKDSGFLAYSHPFLFKISGS